jgi:hypothetical protein
VARANRNVSDDEPDRQPDTGKADQTALAYRLESFERHAGAVGIGGHGASLRRAPPPWGCLHGSSRLAAQQAIDALGTDQPSTADPECIELTADNRHPAKLIGYAKPARRLGDAVGRAGGFFVGHGCFLVLHSEWRLSPPLAKLYKTSVFIYKEQSRSYIGCMDARSLAAAAGVNIGTLNVWVQRGLIPGMTIGTKGRQRDFDRETATGVLLLAELVQFGVGAPIASQIVSETRRLAAKWLLITRLQPSADKVTFHTAHCDSDAEIIDGLNELRARAKKRREPRPVIFMLVDLEAMAEKIRATQDGWERSKEKGSPHDPSKIVR